MPPQTPIKLTKTSAPAAGTTSTTSPSPKPIASLAPEPLPLPGLSSSARLLIAGAVLLVGAVIAAAVFAILTSKPPPDPLAASQASVEEAMQNLRASNWLNLQGVTRDDLERRILLLDAAIYATDAFASAASKLDRKDPENARLYARLDAFVARGKVLRMGRQKMAFLRDHFGHWVFDPIEKLVKWDQRALAEQFLVLESELDDGMASLKAASQPGLPGPPVRNDLLETESQPEPTSQPAPPPK
jgi:hypothetical protein